jgi:hypothetical protein
MEEGTCIRIHYSSLKSNNKGYAGIYWQYPENNWGNETGRDVSWARKLNFWAKGDHGGELVEFKVGGIKNDSIQYASSTGPLMLTNNWKNYVIDLSNKNRSNIIGGFCWVAYSNQNRQGCTFYLNDIRYE